jgi:solute carrier family 25 carnitine/acylcarnitine transporter 20/29
MAAVAVDLASGFLAGIAVTLVGHPFETLKVRLQTQPSPPNQLYAGVVDCARKTLAWEGAGGFYKGVGAPLVGQLFFRSAMFWTNGAYVRWVSGGGARKLSYAQYGVGGAVTWGVCTLIECPLQLMSSQMQVAILRQRADPAYVPEFRNVAAYARGAPARYGLRALYTGVGPQLVRNVCGGFFHFGAFELLRREYAASRGVAVTDIGLAANMVAGSIGGVLFWSVAYPADVVKSALQGDSLDPAKARYTGAVDAVRKLWAEGGAARFGRGYSACLLRAVPANAVLLTTATAVREAGYAWVGARGGGAGAAPTLTPAPAAPVVAAVAAVAPSAVAAPVARR